jgi:hypothetical protein
VYVSDDQKMRSASSSNHLTPSLLFPSNAWREISFTAFTG